MVVKRELPTGTPRPEESSMSGDHRKRREQNHLTRERTDTIQRSVQAAVSSLQFSDQVGIRREAPYETAALTVRPCGRPAARRRPHAKLPTGAGLAPGGRHPNPQETGPPALRRAVDGGWPRVPRAPDGRTGLRVGNARFAGCGIRLGGSLALPRRADTPPSSQDDGAVREL